jgi:hypothetical protein
MPRTGIFFFFYDGFVQRHGDVVFFYLAALAR